MTLAYDAVPWDRVEVGEDDRTLRVYGVTAPEGDRCWRLDRVRAEEHAEAVLVHVGIIEAPAGHPWSFRHGDPVEAEVRLRAPLAGRPIVPARWGSFMRADPGVPRANREQALPDRLLVPRPGILVVGWRGPIPGRLERVELRREEGHLDVALHLWSNGGKLGFARYVTVVESPDAEPGLELRPAPARW